MSEPGVAEFLLTGDIAHDMALVAAISVEDLNGSVGVCVCENEVYPQIVL